MKNAKGCYKSMIARVLGCYRGVTTGGGVVTKTRTFNEHQEKHIIILCFLHTVKNTDTKKTALLQTLFGKKRVSCAPIEANNGKNDK